MRDLAADLTFAHELADAADAISLGRYRSSDLVVDTKPDMTPVTEADRGVEKELRRLIEAQRPGDVVVGEEFGSEEGRWRWIIDPIDGTKNYVRGVPVWATLVALEADGEVVVGVASAPALGRRWWARRGGGAFVTGPGQPATPLAVSRVARVEDAHFAYDSASGFEEYGLLEHYLAFGRRCWRSRGFGDFWSHVLVAEGAVDVAVEPEVQLWDLAPLLVIVEEAGGRFTDLGGRRTADGGSAVSTNGLLHDDALAAFAGGPGRRAPE
jgi:histidinol-phosphatase